MISRLLNAKHWHLFLLTFGIPLIVQIVLVILILMASGFQSDPNVTFIVYYMAAFPVMMLISSGILIGWFWSVGVGLHSKLPDNVRMNVGRFKLLLLIPVVYILFFVGFVINTISGVFQTGLFPNEQLLLFILPLHLFCMFCIFYCLYFVAKTIKSVELQREVSFSDFAGEFFLIWFYPFGIWIIQPKVNSMTKS